MKKMMKKAFLLTVLMFVPFAMQAQNKFHDVEFYNATGPVKSISIFDEVNPPTVINFTPDGKMQQGSVKDAVYDRDGYLQSFKTELQGMMKGIVFENHLKWENGRVKTKIMRNITYNYVYGDKGELVSLITCIEGKNKETPFTDYVFDDHGNWISRKTSVMGVKLKEARKIEYYE